VFIVLVHWNTYRLRIFFIFLESLPFFRDLGSNTSRDPPLLKAEVIVSPSKGEGEKISQDEDTVKDHVCNVA
jgi:hypothetical protein